MALIPQSQKTPAQKTPEDFELLENRPVYQGFFSMHKLRLKHRRFAGDWTPTMSRELLYRGQAVGVLAYDPWQDQVVLVEQFRVGALKDSRGPWLIEVIAGLVEAGENPEEVARREAWEEAGIQLLALEKLFTYYSSPGGTDEQVFLYCGLVDARAASGLHGLEEENEDIRVCLLSREEAFNEAAQGRAGNAMSLISMQWLQDHYLRLQKQVPDQPPVPQSPLRLVQLTDLHLLADPQALFKGVATRSHFLQLLDKACELEPDLLVLSGDLAQDEEEATYAWLFDQLQQRQLPWQWLPGNHDDPQLMQALHPPRFYQQEGGWQLLGLNSRSPGRAQGELASEELAHLQAAVKVDKPLLIVLHHHPLKVGSAWMDALALQNPERLWEPLADFNQPVVLLCGHVHQAAHWQQNGVHIYATPATSLQFAPHQDTFALDEKARPGLRLMDLYADGRWQTRIVRV